jgi:nucleotide-binding universal stress UspA family protein
MSGTIVCGVDLQAGDTAAAIAAGTLARELGGRAVLVHVMDRPSRPPERALPSLRRARHLVRLHAVVNELRLPHGTTVDIAAGEPADELLRAAEERDAELLVLGSRGLHEIGSALRGSVSRALMSSAPCPVAVVPPNAIVASAISSIVCGVEGGPHDVNLLRLAADLARRLSATVRAVQAFNPGAIPPPAAVAPPVVPALRDAARANIRRAIAKAGVKAQPSVLALRPAQALIEAIEEEDAGLIAVASRGRGKLGSILLGSVSVQLAAKAPVPVVVLPRRAELAAGSGHYELAAEAA